mgnify:CR=1 FL=1
MIKYAVNLIKNTFHPLHVPETVNVEPKRRPRKTKESQAEVMEATAEVFESINSVSASSINASNSLNATNASNTSNSDVNSNSRNVNSLDGANNDLTKKEYVFPPINLLKSSKGKNTTNNDTMNFTST